MGLQDVGNYIAVVPGGMKFMRVLLGLIRLLQTETLKRHNKFYILEMPVSEIFDAKFRRNVVRTKEIIDKTGSEYKDAISKQIREVQCKHDALLQLMADFEDSSGSLNRDNSIDETVTGICDKMDRVVRIVSDLERTCGVGPSKPGRIDPAEVSNAISRISLHHKWLYFPEETNSRLDCIKILRFTKRILVEMKDNPISTADIDIADIVTQSHEMELILGRMARIDDELDQIRNLNGRRVRKHLELEALNPKVPVVFPERDYQLDLDESVEFSYSDCRYGHNADAGPLRLPLIDAMVEKNESSSNLTASTSLDRTMPSRNQSSVVLHPLTTVKKRSKAANILRTIQKTNKRSRIKTDTLKELAKNWHLNSNHSSTTSSWKRTLTMSKLESSASTIEDSSKMSDRFSSDHLSETPTIKFFANSTSIFNSTTNEQVIKSPSLPINHFVDITNTEKSVEIAAVSFNKNVSTFLNIGYEGGSISQK